MPALTDNEKLTRLWNATKRSREETWSAIQLCSDLLAAGERATPNHWLRAAAKLTEARNRLALAVTALDKVQRMVERKFGEASVVISPTNLVELDLDPIRHPTTS